MRNDVVLDAGIDLGCHDSAIEEFVFATIRAEADDARGPGAAQAGDLDEPIKRSCVDIDRLGFSGSAREARLRFNRPGRVLRRPQCESHDCNGGLEPSRKSHVAIVYQGEC
jgi:hypothetical protein